MYCERRRSLSGLTFFWQINVKVCFHVVEGNLPVSNNIMWTRDWRVHWHRLGLNNNQEMMLISRVLHNTV